MLFEVYLRSVFHEQCLEYFQVKDVGIGIFDNLLEIELILDCNSGYSDVQLNRGATEQIVVYESFLQQIFPYHVEASHLMKKERIEMKFVIVDDVIQELSQIAFQISTRKELALLRLEDGISAELLRILHVLEEKANF